jgi:monovalent cation:H+ antiporter-2, CPA2 family
MGHIPLIDELALIAVLGVLVTLVLARLKLPTVAGLLAAGALVGPFGLKLIHSMHAIEVLAEVGVVLLLFTIGLEFSLARLKHIFKQVALGGLLQVGVTVAVTAAVARGLGQSWSVGLFYGFVFALSSTAIMLKALTERRELDAPHGRFIVGTLIFQDLCIVPMVLIVPLLAPGAGAGDVWGPLGLAMAKAAGVVIAVLVVARQIVPLLLAWVDRSRSREVFLMAVMGLCIGTAWLTSLAGLSLALGAFLGGMVMADTEYGHRAMGDVMPLQTLFVSLFFVSLGMLFDWRVVLEQPLLVLGMLAGFLVVKGMLVTGVAMAMRFPARVAWLAGVGLAQFGEFGFVLAKLGEQSGVVTSAQMSPLLAAGILSMFLTPVLVRMAPHFTAGERLLAPLEKLIQVRSVDEADTEQGHTLHDHVLLIGYGVAGRAVAGALTAIEATWLAMEMNADTVRAASAAGQPVCYGDATSREALEHAHIAEARAVVLLINDPGAAARVVSSVREVAPHVPILMRARYLGEVGPLQELGAHEVVAEEVEGGVEMLVRVLRLLETPRNIIDERIRAVREETKTAARPVTAPRNTLAETKGLDALKIESVLLPDTGALIGKTLRELGVRDATGVTVVAIRRAGELLEHPDPLDPLRAGDVLYMVGGSERISDAVAWMSREA